MIMPAFLSRKSRSRKSNMLLSRAGEKIRSVLAPRLLAKGRKRAAKVKLFRHAGPSVAVDECCVLVVSRSKSALIKIKFNFLYLIWRNYLDVRQVNRSCLPY